MAAPVYGRGLLGLLKRGIHEVPQIVIPGIPFLILAPFTTWYIYHHEQTHGRYFRTHRQEIIVLRPDDPKVPLVKTAR